jgi:MoaA/NifB/PqqE/SkfB family radical SAM enzyme
MRILNLGITSKCNLKCEYCYQDKEGELSLEEITGLITKHKPEQVWISGGEPGLHPDFNQILEAAMNHSKQVSISTNGSFLYDELMQVKEPERGKILLQVSLPVIDQAKYKEITGSNVSIDEVVKNINEYKKRFVTGINIPVYDNNYPFLKETVAFARKLELPVRISLAIPIGRGKGISILNGKQMKELRHYVLEQRVYDKEIHFNMNNNCPLLEEHYGLKREGSCPGEANEKINIAPDKSVSYCEYLAAQKSL